MTSSSDLKRWLLTPITDFNNNSPIEVIENGEKEALLDYLDDCLKGAPG